MSLNHHPQQASPCRLLHVPANRHMLRQTNKVVRLASWRPRALTSSTVPVSGAELELVSTAPASNNHPPILFLHGAAHGAWCWQQHFMPWLESHGLECHAISFRGHVRIPPRANSAHISAALLVLLTLKPALASGGGRCPASACGGRACKPCRAVRRGEHADNVCSTVQGRSPAPDGTEAKGATGTLASHVQDLSAVIEILRAPPVLVSHSFGGLIAHQYVLDSCQSGSSRAQVPGVVFMASSSPAGVDAGRWFLKAPLLSIQVSPSSRASQQSVAAWRRRQHTLCDEVVPSSDQNSLCWEPVRPCCWCAAHRCQERQCTQQGLARLQVTLGFITENYKNSVEKFQSMFLHEETPPAVSAAAFNVFSANSTPFRLLDISKLRVCSHLLMFCVHAQHKSFAFHMDVSKHSLLAHWLCWVERFPRWVALLSISSALGPSA